jgi:hypothetical protein
MKVVTGRLQLIHASMAESWNPPADCAEGDWPPPGGGGQGDKISGTGSELHEIEMAHFRRNDSASEVF